MYKKIIKVMPLIFIIYSTTLFADIDRQRGIYDAAEEMMAMDEKMNRAIDRHNRLYLDDEDLDQEPTITINDFEEKEDSYQLTREISDYNQTKIEVQLRDGILTISTTRRVTEKTDISESTTISSSASSLFIPTDADEYGMRRSYNNGILKITLPKK